MTESMRHAYLVIALAAMAATARAQPPTLTPGKTQIAFDHVDPAGTERYELCFGTTALTCFAITPQRQGTTSEYRFTVPATVLVGQRPYSIWAIGPRGRAGSATAVFRVQPVAPSAPRKVEPKKPGEGGD